MLRICARRLSTVTQYYPEHYQYPANPSMEEFTKFMLADRKPLVQDTTVFKPKEQIEFNRTGELLLYEAEPYRIKEVLFPYPYCLYEMAAPALLYLYLTNPFGLIWFYNNIFLIGACFSWYPHAEHVFGMRYYVRRLWLLRGGKVLKVEHSGITGLRWHSWIFIDEINLLTPDHQLLEEDKGINAKPLDERGSLKYETHFQVDNFVDAGRNMEDQVLMLCKEGKVHNPDIFEAVMKGFEVDTTNFRVNTLHVERWLEPNTNA